LNKTKEELLFCLLKDYVMKLTNNYLLALGFLFIPFSISFGETLENNLYSLDSKDNGSEVRIFGVGEKSDDETYSGLGIEYKDDQSQAGLEYGNDYQKLYGVYKYALPLISSNTHWELLLVGEMIRTTILSWDM
jgi:hypothetical protein